MAGFSALTSVAQLPELLRATITFLEERDAPSEALAILHKGRGIGALRTAPYMVRVGQAWRLGVVLLDAEGRLYATGEVTRAVEPKLAVTNRSPAADRRREFRRAAVRGKFADGETINHGFTPLTLDALTLEAARLAGLAPATPAGSHAVEPHAAGPHVIGPLSLSGDTVMVAWGSNATTGFAGLMPVGRYLGERAEILAPVGAT
jgi:hypothetical protein